MSYNLPQIVDLYHPDGKDLDVLATKVHRYCYTRDDEDQIKLLRGKSGTAGKAFIEYFNGHGVHDPGHEANLAQGTAGVCAIPKRNNIGWWVCTPTAGYTTSPNGKQFVVNARDNLFAANSYHWFLRYGTGANAGLVVASGSTYPDNVYLDMGNAGVRAKFKEIIDTWTWVTATDPIQVADPVTYDGFFFDNWHTRGFLAQTGDFVNTLQYGPGDGDAYWNAMIAAADDFRSYATSRTGNRGNPGLFAINPIGCDSNVTSNARWLQLAIQDSGAPRITDIMNEFSVVDSNGNYKSSSRWIREFEATKKAVAHGVNVWLIVQIANPETANADPESPIGLKVKFAVATYLLNAGPGLYLRIGSYGTYTHLNIYDEVDTLGAPLGPATESGGVYTRFYEKGYAWVNPAASTSDIVYTGGTATRPLVNEPVDREGDAGNYFEYQMKALSRGTGAITYSLSGASELSINSATGKITGTLAYGGTRVVTVTYSEAGGTSVQRSFKLSVAGGGSEAATLIHIGSINVGDVAYTATDGYIFEEDIATNPNPNITINSSGIGGTGVDPIPDASVPAEYNTSADMHAIGRKWRSKTSAPFPIYSRGVTAGKYYAIDVGWNTITDQAGRVYQVFVDDHPVPVGTVNLSGYADDTFVVRRYRGLLATGSILKTVIDKPSGTYSIRLSIHRVYEDVPQTLYLTSVASGEDEGIPTIATGLVTLFPDGTAPTFADGTPIVVAGTVAITSEGRPPETLTGLPTIVSGSVTILPDGMASQEAVGVPTVQSTTYYLVLDGAAPTSAAGDPAVLPGTATVQPAGGNPAAAIGTPSIGAGLVTISPGGTSPATAEGTPQVVAGMVPLALPGAVSTAATGIPTILAGMVTVIPDGIAPVTTVGTPTLALEAVAISPVSATSGESVGYPTVVAGTTTISPDGSALSTAVGIPTVQGSTYYVIPEGVDAIAVAGTPTIHLPAIAIDVSGAASTIGTGTPSLAFQVLPPGAASTAITGVPTVQPGTVMIEPDGINLQGGTGIPTLDIQAAVLRPAGGDHSAQIGSPTIVRGTVTLYPQGADNSEGSAAGRPFITYGRPGKVLVIIRSTGVEDGHS